jgi:nitronate monooxygenase
MKDMGHQPLRLLTDVTREPFCTMVAYASGGHVITTRLTKMFGLRYPIVSAPMGLHSGGTLAAAVSKAGALGSFGGLHPQKGTDWLLGEIAHIRTITGAPFAVGFINDFIPMFSTLFDATLEAKPPVIALSFGNPEPWLSRAKAAGAKVMCQVQTIHHAREAVAAGADLLVVQGNEAGGHTGPNNLLPFLAQIVDRFPDVPVLAAGGIASGRTLAATLAAGAEGAWVGTALLATPEAVEVSNEHKQRIVESNGDDTVYTEVFDIVEEKVFGIKWPEGIASRVYRNRFVNEWHHREHELRSHVDEVAHAYARALQQRDLESTAIAMGQSAAFVDAIRPAADVVRSICEDAERILRGRPSQLLA